MLELLKNNYEIIIMLVGILLIVMGLILFITGRYSNNENHVEGFGIKMDVKNPSLILIVFGVFLLVAPMTLNKKEPSVESRPGNLTQKVEETPSPLKKTEVDETPKSRAQPKSVAPKPEIKEHGERRSTPVKAPFLGTYQLVSYIENGMTIPVNGQLAIGNLQNGSYPFSAKYQVVDEWGNVLIFMYEGYFVKRQGQWFLKVNRSNDPDWVDLGEVATRFIFDRSSNSLGLRYFYDADVASVWQKIR
ncbi:hypothetical protein [Hydrogenimonas cancrithermarum]|uniref:Uncharacterized protein n=1 Tax=Hydrogenimonas cancrithermarum TaxID=2993563 RepID=A0ABM8FNA2_9BACT|nr:hypothetical protein [Hydrogenimonas cancrithermarum]BDY13877.1 hypothetical protein HCR_21890 [Hydrogenimonas cancrithermarum]